MHKVAEATSMTSNNRRKRTLAVLGTGLIAVGIFVYREAKNPVSFVSFLRAAFHENNFDATQFNKVVGSVQDGSLRPDANGVVVLPQQFAALAKDGRAYVTSHQDGELCV